MTMFNRVLGLLLGLLLVATGLTILASLFGTFRPEFWPLGWWLESGLSWLADLERPGRLWGLLAGLAITVGGLGLAVAELGGGRPPHPLVLSEAPAGRITVSVATLAGIADHAASQVEGVLAAESAIANRRDSLRMRCTVRVNRDAVIPVAAEQVQAAIQGALEHHLGLPATQVTVHAERTGATGLRRVN